jgi:hypothetical protein
MGAFTRVLHNASAFVQCFTKTKLYEKIPLKIMQSILIEQGTIALYVHT